VTGYGITNQSSLWNFQWQTRGAVTVDVIYDYEPIPEPGSMLALLSGVAMSVMGVRRRRQ